MSAPSDPTAVEVPDQEAAACRLVEGFADGRIMCCLANMPLVRPSAFPNRRWDMIESRLVSPAMDPLF